MYKHLTAEDHRSFFGFAEDYNVDGIIVIGTHPKAKEYPHLYEALKRLDTSFTEEKMKQGFFEDIKCFIINGKRIWVDVVLGTAYLSELLHVGCLLGSQKNILVGSCGALQSGIETCDTIVPSSSFGNESSTRMYNRDNRTYTYPSDPGLSESIKKLISHREKIHSGKMVTVQSMLAETQEDVDEWQKAGYVAVDMESATLFAVSEHFNVPAAALLYVADNLITNELVTDPSYALLSIQRKLVRTENYEIAFKVVIGK